MYAHILVILITGTPNYHHCLLSSNLGTIPLRDKGVWYKVYIYILDNF